MSQEIRDTLGRTALFAPLGDDGLERFVELGRVEYWTEGATIMQEGDQGPRMVVLLDGRAAILRRDPRGAQRILAELGPGDVLGEMALLLESPRTATVHARTDIRAFSLDRRVFREMVDAGDPAALRFGLELAKVLAARLLRLDEVVVELLMHADEGEPLRRRLTEAREEIFALWSVDRPWTDEI